MSSLVAARTLADLGLPVISKTTSTEELEAAADKSGEFAKGYFEIVQATPRPTAKSVIMVPGFLSQNYDLPQGLVERSGLLRNDANSSWFRRMEEVVAARPINVVIYHWPSRGLLPGWPRPKDNAIPVLAHRSKWMRARNQADLAGADLYERIRDHGPERMLLVGHSLGGKIALRAAQFTGTHSRAPFFGAIAMGAAVTERWIDWESVRRGTSCGTEVFHSPKDPILALVYKLGNMSRKNPIGLVGLSETNANLVRVVNVGRFQRWKGAYSVNGKKWSARHNWYRKHLDKVLGLSNVWQQFVS